MQTPGYSLEALGDEYMLVHASAERALCTNPTAALVWSLCDGERSVEAIHEYLLKRYPTAEPRLARDLTFALETLRSHGALRSG